MACEAGRSFFGRQRSIGLVVPHENLESPTSGFNKPAALLHHHSEAAAGPFRSDRFALLRFEQILDEDRAVGKLAAAITLQRFFIRVEVTDSAIGCERGRILIYLATGPRYTEPSQAAVLPPGARYANPAAGAHFRF